jgi:hypothetical protein
MSASPSTPPARGRHELASAPRGARCGRAPVGVLLGLLMSGLAGCAGEAGGAATSSPAVSRNAPLSPAASPVDEQAALLAQYRKFWQSLTPISRMPEAERQAALVELAVDPALKSLLAGMRANDEAGEVFYGAHVPRPEPVPISPDGKTALVDDCQDSTGTGLASRSTMKIKTRGVRNNHVNVTMKKSAEGVWKVAFVAYTKSPC